MSHNDKLSGSYLRWITVVLLIAFSLSIGSCQLDLIDSDMLNEENNLTLINNTNLTNNYNEQMHIISVDTRNISSYGNGPMGLVNTMNTSLSYGKDGFLEKSRKTSLLTFGTERMDIIEASNLTYLDKMGNVYNYTWERSATLKDISFPFAVMRDDLVKLSNLNLSEEGYYSKTYLLLPEGFESVYDLGTLNATFGNLSQIEIKTFKYDYGALEYVDMENLSQLFGSGLSGETMELFGDSLSQFYDLLRNDDMRQMMTDYQNSTRNANLGKKVYNPRRLFQESMGGVTCIWGSMNA